MSVLGLCAAISMIGAGADEWTSTLSIEPTVSTYGGHFGQAVDVYENIAIVGAPIQGLDPYTPEGTGSAQVIEFSAWGGVAGQQNLVASDGVEGDAFGYRVKIGELIGGDSDGVAYVAAPLRKDGDDVVGGVYCFAPDVSGDIVEVGLIEASGEASHRFFGGSLDFDGSRLAVGAPYESSLHGAVHVFDLGTDGMPSGSHTLVPAGLDGPTYFGWSTSLDGSQLAAGGIVSDASGVGAGAVYVFERQGDGTWVESAVVLPDIPADNMWFGTDVMLSGDLLAVGAIYHTVEGELAPVYTGGVYIFTRQDGAWVQQDILTPPVVESSLSFGVSLAFDNNVLVVGSNYWPSAAGEATAGAAAIYNHADEGVFELSRVWSDEAAAAGSQLGTGVAIPGPRILVGGMELAEAEGGIVHVLEQSCAGDFNGDGVVGAEDILQLINHWGDDGILAVDLEQTFEVDVRDLVLLLEYYGACS